MLLTNRLGTYGVHLYFLGFFFILFFQHKHIDVLRIPFVFFIIWQISKKKLAPTFLVDPVSISIFSFLVIAGISNLINGIPLDKIHIIFNWLFPYYLGKYALKLGDHIKIESILLYLLLCATLFSLIGIIGYLFHLTSLFGIELFSGGHRYAFTISGTNRAGFCIGVTLVLGTYLFVKDRFVFNRKMLFPLVCWLITFASLFLIKERKTILVVCTIVFALLLLYRNYRLAAVLVGVASLVLLLAPIPERYHLKEMALNQGMLSRLNAWESAMGLFKEKPLFGNGFPSFKKASKAYFEENKDQYKFKTFINYAIAHNINFNTLAETGLLGFIAINIIFFSAWRFFTYTYSEPLLFVMGIAICFIYITMQVGNFAHSATRTDMSFLVIGLYFALDRQHRKLIEPATSP